MRSYLLNFDFLELVGNSW